MKFSYVKNAGFALLAVFVASSALAQTSARRPAAGARAPEIKIKIKKLEGLDREGKMLTPEFRTNYSRSAKRGEWCEIKTEYYTYDEWLDELTFSYYVMVRATEGEARGTYSFYDLTVRYVDVEKDNDHVSTVYLHPKTVERFGWPVAIGVVITAGGKEVAKDVEASIPMPKNEDWWKSDAVLKNPRVKVTKRSGRLLNRSQTPFALVNIDDYEVIQ